MTDEISEGMDRGDEMDLTDEIRTDKFFYITNVCLWASLRDLNLYYLLAHKPVLIIITMRISVLIQ